MHHMAFGQPPPPPPPPPQDDRSRSVQEGGRGAARLRSPQPVDEGSGAPSKNARPVSVGPLAEIMERRRQMGIHMDSFDN